MHHERSVSPVQLESGESDQGEISNLSTPPRSVSEQMCQDQDFPEKCSFLNSFHLSVVDKNKKKGTFMEISSGLSHPSPHIEPKICEYFYSHTILLKFSFLLTFSLILSQNWSRSNMFVRRKGNEGCQKILRQVQLLDCPQCSMLHAFHFS